MGTGYFVADLSIGEQGEAAAVSWLKQLGYTDIQDTRKLKEWQKLDVDYLATYTTGWRAALEAKADTKDLGNILLETVKNSNTKAPGWALITQADIVTVYKISSSKLYVLRGHRLKKYIERHYNDNLHDGWKRPYNHFWAKNYNKKGEVNYESENLVCPVDDMAAEGVIHSVWQQQGGRWVLLNDYRNYTKVA